MTDITNDLRQLDRELAELMGYYVVHGETYTDWFLTTPKGHRYPAQDSEEGAWSLVSTLAFSSSWSGFGLLVEECERRGWTRNIRTDRNLIRGAGVYFVHAATVFAYGKVYAAVDAKDDKHAFALAMRDALKAAKE